MSSVIIAGNTSGTITLDAPNVAGTTVLTLPTSSGTVTVAGVNSNIVAGTSVASTSGTSIDFTSIPSWVKRITVMFNGVSTNGVTNILLQLGTSGGVQTSGYTGTSGYVGGTPVSTNPTNGFSLFNDTASDTRSGAITFSQLNASSNIWVCCGFVGYTARTFNQLTSGSVTLSGTLTQVRITTVNGTDTFDAGSVNILYE
jgi:hypothetical protein